MNKTLNNLVSKNIRKMPFVFLLCAPVFEMNAQCVVGGTDFEPRVEICNPSMVSDTNDVNGWFNSKVGDLLKKQCGKTGYFATPGEVKQTGMPSNIISVNGNANTGWDDMPATGNVDGKDAGFATVVANPKLISPYLSEGSGSEMFVAIANGHEIPFFTYSLSGLKPGSSVTFSADIYNLLDMGELETALRAINSSASSKDMVLEIKMPYGASYIIQKSNGMANYKEGRINGVNQTSVSACTAILYNQPSGDKSDPVSPTFGTSATLTLKTTADETGCATFYLFRNAGGNFCPIGIDNIQVTGSIVPTIKASGNPCPLNPFLMRLGSNYPEGTKFEWKVKQDATQTSSKATFSFTPIEKGSYDVTCTVTLPGCTPVTSDVFTVTTSDNCCTDANGAPLALVNLYKNDFGYFSGTNYTYTNVKGTEITVPATDLLNGTWGPCIEDQLDGGKGVQFKYNKDIYNGGYAVGTQDPYGNSGGDHTGNAGGGMLVMDIKDKGWMDKAIYKQEIPGMCKGKIITFGAAFKCINTPQGSNKTVGTLELLITDSKGNVLKDIDGNSMTTKPQALTNPMQWVEVEKKFQLGSDETSIWIQLISREDDYSGDGRGDFALDDIYLQVCAPPDVNVEPNLTADELLDLCVDKEFTLTADMEDAAKKAYVKPGYLFQYTTDDPSITPDKDITWVTLDGQDGTKDSYTFSRPAEVEPFLSLKNSKDAKKLYFRLVVGEIDYLMKNEAEWGKQSAQSACRAVSISTIPIIAALNCAKCYTPESVKISDAFDAVNISTTKKALCVGDKVNLSALVTATTDEGDPYSGYYLFWKKAGADISGYTKLEDFSGKGTPAKDLVIENDGSYTSKTSVKYTVIAVDTFEFKSVAAATCKDSAEIEITFLPKPELEDRSYEFCEGLSTAALPQALCTDCKLNYLESDKTTPATIELNDLKAAATAHEFYYYLSTEDGCVSDTMLISVQVNANPVYEPAEIAPFCAGQASPSTLETVVGDSIITWTPNSTNLNELEAGTTKYTYVVEDKNTGCKSKEKNFSVTVNPAAKVELTATPDCGKTAIVANITPSTATAEWSLDGTAISAKSEFVFGEDAAGQLIVSVPEGADYCAAADTVDVELWAVPEDPTATDVTCYLKSQEASFKDVQNQCAPAAKFNESSAANEGAELVWRKKGESSWSTTAPTPTVANASDPKEETIDYEVALRNAKHTTCISKAVPFTVHIYGAPVPLKHDSAYCVDTKAAPLSAYVEVDNTIPNTYELRYYADKDMKNPLDASYVPETSTPGEWVFYATQYSANGGESEPVAVKITTYGVLAPTVNKFSYEYCSDETAEQLSAALNVKEPYYMSNGVFWKVGSDEQTTAPTPAVSSSYVSGTEELQVYYAYQKYTIPSSKEVCMGEEIEVNVSFQSTADPTGTFNVGYVYSDFENNKVVDILKKNSETVDIESGFTYEYIESDNLGNEKPGASWTTVVPKPEDISKRELDANNGSAKRYWLVRRKSNAGKGCYSGKKLITVTISDSPMPMVDPLSYCEGETIDDLINGVTINESNKKKENYQLLWYTKMPVTPEEQEAGSLKPFETPASTVASPTEKTVYTYYVAQQDISVAEKPIGTATPFVITVYPNPVQTITDPAAVCGNETKEVALAPAVSIASVESASSKYFEDVNGQSEIKSGKVSASGTYYAQSSYTVTASNGAHECKSTIDPIKVTVETLEIKLAENQTTCPNSKATLGATVGTNVESVEFTWTAKSGSDQGGETVTSANGEASASFITTNLAGDTRDMFYYDLTVVADQCKVTKKDISITLGDGPVSGTLTLTESDNLTSPKVYQNSRSFVSDPFYTCGGAITAVANFEGDADYTWSNGSTGSSVTITGPGIYTIKFTNECATQTTFEVKDAAIKNNMLVLSSGADRVGENETLVICEDEEAKFTLTYDAPEDGTISWTKGTDPAYNIKGKTSSISTAKASDSGDYTYTITNHGCTATGTASLKVRPVIVFKPEQNEYIIRRDDNVTIVNNITVPESAVPSDIKWMENGASASSDKDYTFAVTEDHAFEIQMSDPDYCDASAKVEVKVDARLSLSVSLEEQICRGDKAYLEIDTTGTGAFRKKSGHSIVVEETIGATTRTYASGWRVADGKLILEVSPSNNATYTVTFSYDNQSEKADASIEVLQPIKIAPQNPYNVCAGDEIEIEVNVTSASGDVAINWNEDPTITGALQNNNKQTVTPDYEPSLATAFKYKKVYSYVAHMDGCKDKPGQVIVTVDAPIEGQLIGDTVCEGQNVIVTADYNAAQFVWSVSNVGNPIGQGKVLSYLPEKTALYTVKMARGICTKEDTITVTVHSNPKITSVDSVGTRSYVIMVDESYGTNPSTFMYAVDNSEYTYSAQKENLIFNNHIAYVVDEVGCRDTMPFFIPAPSVKIPNWFSPNGDGDYDYWTPTNLKEIYPNAVVKIYDRWGKLVAEFKGSDLGWDGTYNGNNMPTTDYWYEINVQEIDKIFTGHFTLLRR